MLEKADEWIKNGYSVLLVGGHGVGKTAMILDLAKKHGLNLAYYSCSTLDPFTDLVGVPVPQDGPYGKELQMVRPRRIDEAEMLFFDELNRADPKVLNAVLEVIQFGTINGEPLRKLKCLWAAMNPPDGRYQVQELDPALVDRFDVYESIKGEVDPQWLVEHGVTSSIAQALQQWWQDQDEDMRQNLITPRRIEKIARVYMQTGNFRSAIPSWWKIDSNKLREMLKSASEKTANLPIFTRNDLVNDAETVISYLASNPAEVTVHQQVLSVIDRAKAGDSFMRNYAPVLNVIMPGLLEGFLLKLEAMKWQGVWNYASLGRYPNLESVVRDVKSRRGMN